MCQFVEDIYVVVDLLCECGDIVILEECDYVINVKLSGYCFYYIVIEYLVQLIIGEKKILVEIQVWMLVMNFWVIVEYFLNYKYQGDFLMKLVDCL